VNYLDKLKRHERGETKAGPQPVIGSPVKPPTAKDITIEPAAPNAKPVYWERATGEIVGPARLEFLAKVGRGITEQYWVIVDYEGQPAWVRSDRLRSQRQCERQVRPSAVDAIHRGFGK
jgi:hypothetical protein